MAETNGTPEKEEKGQRNALGQFVEGWQGGPGRPRSPKVDYLQALRDAIDDAKRHMTAEEMVGEVALAMFDAAIEGDVAAAKLFLDRTAGVLVGERPGLELNIDNRSVSIGPPMPEGRKFGDYLRDGIKAAEGLLEDGDDNTDG